MFVKSEILVERIVLDRTTSVDSSLIHGIGGVYVDVPYLWKTIDPERIVGITDGGSFISLLNSRHYIPKSIR
jgi:hypothetical protein